VTYLHSDAQLYFNLAVHADRMVRGEHGERS
jgi:hypothetical protein